MFSMKHYLKSTLFNTFYVIMLLLIIGFARKIKIKNFDICLILYFPIVFKVFTKDSQYLAIS